MASLDNLVRNRARFRFFRAAEKSLAAVLSDPGALLSKGLRPFVIKTSLIL